MPYKPTGKPNGRPRKVFEPAEPRRYVAASAPAPKVTPADTKPPMMGQRVRVKQRRPSLNPTPLKA